MSDLGNFKIAQFFYSNVARAGKTKKKKALQSLPPKTKSPELSGYYSLLKLPVINRGCRHSFTKLKLKFQIKICIAQVMNTL